MLLTNLFSHARHNRGGGTSRLTMKRHLGAVAALAAFALVSLPGSASAASDLQVTAELLEVNGREATVKLTLTNLGPDDAISNADPSTPPPANLGFRLTYKSFQAEIIEETPACVDSPQSPGYRRCSDDDNLAVGETRTVTVRARATGSPARINAALEAASTSDGEGNDYEETDYENQNPSVAFGAEEAAKRPVARCDAYLVSPGRILRVSARRGLLANDKSFTGPPIVKLTSVSFSRGSHPLKVRRDGSFTLTARKGARKLVFRYQAVAGGLASKPATVTTYVGKPPTAGGLGACETPVFSPRKPRTPRADDDCTTVPPLRKNKNFNAFILAEEVGLVGWRTYVSITAKDRCDHGSLRTGLSFYDANLEAKDGRIEVDSVQYKTSASNAWRWLPTRCCANGSSVVFTDGGHLDLSKKTRITRVRANTHLVFDGSVYAPRSYTCDLIKRTCS